MIINFYTSRIANYKHVAYHLYSLNNYLVYHKCRILFSVRHRMNEVCLMLLIGCFIVVVLGIFVLVTMCIQSMFLVGREILFMSMILCLYIIN